MKFSDAFRGISNFRNKLKERRAAKKNQGSSEETLVEDESAAFGRESPPILLDWAGICSGGLIEGEPTPVYRRRSKSSRKKRNTTRANEGHFLRSAAGGSSDEPRSNLPGPSNNHSKSQQSLGNGEGAEDHAAEDADDENNSVSSCQKLDTDSGGDVEEGRSRLLDPNVSSYSSKSPGAEPRAKKLTDCSDVSSDTVQRDPSKRSDTLMAPSGGSVYGNDRNPFSDRNVLRNSSGNSGSSFLRGADAHHRRSAGITSETEYTNVDEVHAGQTGRRYSGSIKGNAVYGGNGRSSDDIVWRIFDNCGSMRSSLIRARAIMHFVTASQAVGMQILEPTPGLFPSTGHRPLLLVDHGDDEEAQESGPVMKRLRSARSTIGIRHKKSFQKSLRRIKSLANLSSPSYPPGSLNGISLKDLARLGGHSYVKLPREYAPVPLKLPTCIASVVESLAQDGVIYAGAYGAQIKNLLVKKLYSDYAAHVLEAEVGKGIIESTARSTDIPMSTSIPDRERLIGTVFRHLLLGIPGGILGSKYLYRVLKMIHEFEFGNANSVKANSSTSLPKLSSNSLKLTTLAIVALTDEMQLELICAVFGLLSKTLDSAEKLAELHKLSSGQECDCGVCGSIPGARFLGCAFATLFADPQYFSLTDIPDSVDDNEVDGTDVAVMLIHNWVGICELLTLWEVFGLRE